MFSVVFQRRTDVSLEEEDEKTREKTREKIMQLIKSNKSITAAELAQLTGISEKGIEYHLSNLKNKNKIARIGSDRGGHWEILI